MLPFESNKVDYLAYCGLDSEKLVHKKRDGSPVSSLLLVYPSWTLLFYHSVSVLCSMTGNTFGSIAFIISFREFSVIGTPSP